MGPGADPRPGGPLGTADPMTANEVLDRKAGVCFNEGMETTPNTDRDNDCGTFEQLAMCGRGTWVGVETREQRVTGTVEGALDGRVRIETLDGSVAWIDQAGFVSFHRKAV